MTLVVLSWGRSRFEAEAAGGGGVLIVCCFVIQEDVVAKLKEVARMIASKVNASPFVGAVLMAAGVIGNSSPA